MNIRVILTEMLVFAAIFTAIISRITGAAENTALQASTITLRT